MTRRSGPPRLHPAVDPSCPRCHGLGATVERDGELAVAIRCTCVRVCPKCSDSGWVSPDGTLMGPGKRSRCSCGALDVRIGRFNAVKIPGRHAGSTLSSYKPIGKDGSKVLTAVSRWVKEYARNDDNRGLILYGDVGRGKTHLLCAMLREVVFQHGASARFAEFSHLLSDLKADMERGGGASARIDELVGVDVLAIDELGKGRNTEYEGTVIDELVSRRYNALRTIVGTTNFPPVLPPQAEIKEVQTIRREAFADRVGQRVYSRLREVCEFQPVHGEDYRLRVRGVE